MRLIKDIVPKPSDAIQAMIDGLLEQDARRGFKVDMDTFGDTLDGICYGCAATCAVQKIAGKDFSPDNIGNEYDESEYLGFERLDLRYFEGAINNFRCFDFGALFFYYGVDCKEWEGIEQDSWFLRTDTWREQLPAVQEYCNKLKDAGL